MSKNLKKQRVEAANAEISNEMVAADEEMKEVLKEREEWRVGNYEVGRLIGSGMIGVVAVARHHLTHEIVCLKFMEVEKIIEKGLMRNVLMECEFHYDLIGEPNIMPLRELIIREKDIIMVLPYISGRDLYGHLR